MAQHVKTGIAAAAVVAAHGRGWTGVTVSEGRIAVGLVPRSVNQHGVGRPRSCGEAEAGCEECVRQKTWRSRHGSLRFVTSQNTARVSLGWFAKREVTHILHRSWKLSSEGRENLLWCLSKTFVFGGDGCKGRMKENGSTHVKCPLGYQKLQQVNMLRY